MSNAIVETEVLIAGGGPVGLITAIDLAHFGVRSVLVERNLSTTRHPKMDITNGRTMELFRRTGVAEKVRAAGVSEMSNADCTWLTDLTTNGHILHKFGYAHGDHEYWRRRTENDGTLTLEPSVRVSQIVVEPVLKQAAEETGMADVRFGWALVGFEQDEDGVTSQIKNMQTEEIVTVRSKYLVGCDGGNSLVRTKLGITSEGPGPVGNAYLVHFRSTDLKVLHHFGQAWHYMSPSVSMIAQNDTSEWTVHRLYGPTEKPGDLDPRQVIEETFGCKFDFEVLVANPWTAHFVVANDYGGGRVFIAGDACHQYVPTGGYGMNTGAAEASNLAWKLAATIHGFGGPDLLASYGRERQPIAMLSMQTSMRHMGIRMQIAQLYAEISDIHGDSEQAESNRARLGLMIAELGNGENEGWGTEHGYSYDGSPVIVPDGTPAPHFDWSTYVPTTRPGARLPSLYLEDGSAVYDRLGKWFTLIVTDESDCSAFTAAAQRLSIPLEILAIADKKANQVYQRPLLLVRPDHHVAWRGAAVPPDPEGILRTAVGMNA